MDDDTHSLERRTGRKLPARLLAIEPLPYESTPLHGILIINLTGVDAPSSVSLPLVPQGSLLEYYIVHALFPQVRDWFSPGLNGLTSIQMQASQGVPCYDWRHITHLVSVLGQPAQAPYLPLASCPERNCGLPKATGYELYTRAGFLRVSECLANQALDFFIVIIIFSI